MNFAAIPAKASIFLDSNIFVYSFTNEPTFGPACTDLLERVEFSELTGYISTQHLSEVSHRLMTAEACQAFGWPHVGITRQLRRHPAQLQKLQEYRRSLDDIVAIGVRILPVYAQDILRAGDLCRQHGLLSSDALIVALMQANNLSYLASNDADFDRVPGITRYSPT